MEINNLDEFLKYYSRLRERTLRLIGCIPSDKIEWKYDQERWSLGYLVMHIAAIERYMYAENVMNRPSRYAGCGCFRGRSQWPGGRPRAGPVGPGSSPVRAGGP